MDRFRNVLAKSAMGMLALALLMLAFFTSSAYAENYIYIDQKNGAKSDTNTDAPVILEAHGGSRHSGGDGSSQPDEYSVDFWGVRVNDPQGYENIDSIVAKAPDGSLYRTLSDDGKHCDENPGDGIYGWCGTNTNLPPLTGNYTIIAKDKDGNTAAKTITVERILDIPRNPSPGGSAFINTQTPTLSWNTVDGAVKYNLGVDDENGNLWRRGDIIGNSISYNDDGTGQNFTEGGIYYWGVGACDNDDNCSWHHTWIEFVYSTSDAPVILEAHGGSRHSGFDNGSQQDEYTVDFWGVRVNDPQGYENIESVVAKSPDGSIYQTLSDDGKHCDDNPGDGIYDWCGTDTSLLPLTGNYNLVVKDKDGNTGTKIISIERILDIIRNSSPGGGTVIRTPNPILTWSSVAGAVKYDLVVNDENGNQMWHRENISETSIAYNDDGTGQDLLEGNVYYWGGGACDNDDNCSWRHITIKFVYSKTMAMISGRVTSEDGEPIPSICVDATGLCGNPYYSGNQTDKNGNYSIAVPTGSYYLHTNTSCNTVENYVGEWWNSGDGTGGCNKAESVAVKTGETKLNNNFILAEGGTISGKVTLSDGVTPVPNLHLYATDYDTDQWVGGTNTDENGDYKIKGLYAGKYKVKACASCSGQGAQYVLDEFYDNARMWHESAPISVTTGKDTPGINFKLEKGGIISGKITSIDEEPIVNVEVVAFSKCEDLAKDISYGSFTDKNGNYFITAPEGEYSLKVWTYNSPSYLGELWNSGDGTSDCDKAEAVSVNTEQTTSGINFTLAEGGWISGKVIAADGQPVANVCLNASDSEGNWRGGSGSDENGNYSFVVPNGNYRIGTDVSCGGSNVSRNFLDECWNGGEGIRDCNQAVMVTANAGQTTPNINFTLATGGRISGKVTAADGKPVANVCINALDNPCGGMWRGGTGTDENGNYSFVAPQGNYFINTDVFCGGKNPSLNLVSEFWNDTDGTTYCNEAEPVNVTTGQTTANINFSLAQGGMISGRVTASDGKPISNMGLTARFDCENFSLFMTRTDENGDYSVAVPNGTYFVETWNGIQNYLGEWWNGEDGTNVCDKAKAVSVSAEQTVSGINFTLRQAFSIEAEIMNVHEADGRFKTYIHIYNIYDESGSVLPDNIDSISITGPNGKILCTKDDLTYEGEGVFFAAIPGSPAIGKYTFTVISGGKTFTTADIQTVNRTLPIPDKSTFSPSDGEKNTSLTPTFRWQAIDYDEVPIYYQLKIYDKEGNQIFSTGQEQNLLSFTLHERILEPGETYTWYVRVLDDSGWVVAENRSNSERVSFTVSEPPVFVIPTASIIIDGNSNDWSNIAPAFTDKINDRNPNSDFDGTDLSNLYLAKDSTFLYVMMKLYDGDPITGTLYVFETLQKPFELHTSGDRSIVANYSNGEWMASVGERTEPDGSGHQISSYPSSHVGTGADFIEWKVPLSDCGELDGRYIRAYIHVVDPLNEVSDDDTPGIKLGYKPIPVPLLPPGNLEARSGKDSVRLRWESSPSTYLAGYNVYRAASDNGPWTKINTALVSGEDYEDTGGLTGASIAYYHVRTADTSGNESSPSDIVSAVVGRLKVFIPDARGNKGTTVPLQVNIANADNLKMCGLDIYVTYDKNVIEAAGIKRSPLSSEYGWDYRIQEPGIVRAVLATGTEGEPLRGDGVLFWLDFNVKGNEGDRTELKFQIDATSIYDCGDLKNEVPLDLNDTGIFTVNWKNILCDLNGDGKVDSSDIAFLLKLAVGNAELSEDLRHIGDSSGDGRIRSNDAAMCMRISTGNPLAPPSSGMKRNTPRSSSVTVNISDNIEVLAGGSIWVPVNISDMKDLAGADIVLNYDPTLLTVKNVRTSSLTENFDLDFNVQTGQAKISLSCKDGDGLSGGSGTLVEAEFTAKPNAGISSLTLASVRLNDSYGQDFEISALQTEIDSQNGELKVIVPSLMDAILCLKILTGMDISIDDTDADFIAKGKIELSDVIYILQWIAGIRFN